MHDILSALPTPSDQHHPTPGQPHSHACPMPSLCSGTYSFTLPLSKLSLDALSPDNLSHLVAYLTKLRAFLVEHNTQPHTARYVAALISHIEDRVAQVEDRQMRLWRMRCGWPVWDGMGRMVGFEVDECRVEDVRVQEGDGEVGGLIGDWQKDKEGGLRGGAGTQDSTVDSDSRDFETTLSSSSSSAEWEYITDHVQVSKPGYLKKDKTPQADKHHGIRIKIFGTIITPNNFRKLCKTLPEHQRNHLSDLSLGLDTSCCHLGLLVSLWLCKTVSADTGNICLGRTSRVRAAWAIRYASQRGGQILYDFTLGKC
ncbi:hypothetical protein BKA63DRAFT_492985 [Paraphoma chrysanthemicola]|nr:hypothetical protein BKA63DRAFT_492985 [Paraphoma chrysanthemicola]